MRWILLALLIVPVVHAKAYLAYPPAFDSNVPLHERITRPHLYPGQSVTTKAHFQADPLRPGSSTVRWTSQGSYAVHLDRVHLLRDSYTLRLKSTRGWRIRAYPFDTTKIYLPPDYYDITYDRITHTVWLAKYAR